MVFGEISVHGFIGGEAQADAGSNQAVRFFGRIFADDSESDLARTNLLQSLTAGNQFAVRREDGRNADDVASSDSGVAEGQLKTGKTFAMVVDAFGDENFLSNKRHSAGPRPP